MVLEGLPFVAFLAGVLPHSLAFLPAMRQHLRSGRSGGEPRPTPELVTVHRRNS